MSSAKIKQALKQYANSEKAAFFPGFFKIGVPGYATDDKFLGVTVPNQRKVAKQFKNLSLDEITKLLHTKVHEYRLTALIILTTQFENTLKQGEPRQSLLIVEYYLDNLDWVNNWDLVDATAHKILGNWLLGKKDRKILYELADSSDLWRQRVSVVATMMFIKVGDFKDILKLSKKFLTHEHDYIHKAVGWMLREVGKKDVGVLRGFLDQYAHQMPRVMLRYSLEKLAEKERKKYLAAKK